MSLHLRALEPRVMFDAAMPATIAAAETQAPPEPADAGKTDFTAQQEQLAASASAAAAPVAAPAPITEIMFVTADLARTGGLPQPRDGVEVVVLSADRDGFQQVAEALNGHDGVTALHFVTHGDSGRVDLGGSTLTAETLASRAAEIASWADHLAAGADILLYGCDVAQGAAGQSLVDGLASLTGADVAASTDITGNGDWTLESTTGPVETPLFADVSVLSQYQGLLPSYLSDASLTNWVRVTPLNGQHDSIGDIQAQDKSADIVGDTTYGAAYVRYDDNGTAGDTSDDLISYRVRMDQSGFSAAYAVVGVDYGVDGDIDFFVGVYDPSGNNGEIAVYDSDPSKANDGPSNTGIVKSNNGVAGVGQTGTQVLYSGAARTGMYSIDLATGASNLNGTADYFVSWTVKVNDINTAAIVAKGGADAGQAVTLTPTTQLRYIVATSKQTNALNVDFSGSNGIPGSGSWASLGAFSEIMTPSGAVVDATAPTLTSIVRQVPVDATTNADEVTFRVTFSEAVTNVDSSDFALSGTAAASGTVAQVTAVSSSVYEVKVTGITNSNGTLNLDIANGHNIKDAATNALTNLTPTSGTDETYTIDNTPPAAPSVALTSDSGSSGGDNISAVGTLNVTGVEVGATVEYSTDGNTWVTSFTPVQGSNTVQVRQKDAAGNTSNAASLTFTYDTTAPTLTASTPADNATGVSVSNDLTLTFSEAVARGTGTIKLYRYGNDALVESFDVTDTSRVGVSGSQVTLNPTNNLLDSTQYYLLIDSTAVKDVAGNAYAGLTGKTSLDFTTGDFTAPTLTASTPADNAGNVAPNANLVLTFSETVARGTGAIELRKYSDDSLVESFDITDTTRVGVSGSQVTLNPTNNLLDSTQYYLLIDSTAVKDVAGNAYAGLTGKTSLDFTTAEGADSTAPTLTASTPADNATGVSVSNDLTLTFSEAVARGTGTIELRKSSDDSLVENFDVTDATRVGVSGSQITLNPTNNLLDSTQYYLLIGNTAVKDLAGNAYAGLTGKTSLDFTTGDFTAPTLTASTPADNATGVSVSNDLTLTFSEAVARGTGTIELRKFSDDSLVESFDVTDTSRVGVSGSQVTLNPTNNLLDSTQYYLLIGATAVKDVAGNAYAGLAGKTSLDFTTSDSTAPTLIASTPADNAVSVSVSNDLTLTFSEAVARGTGTIELRKSSDDSLVESFAVTDTARVGVNGSQITLNPTNNLLDSTQYYLLIGGTAVKDVAGNAYAGLSGKTSLDFTTGDSTAPRLVSALRHGPSTELTNAQSVVFRVTFSEGVTGVDAADFQLSGSGSAGAQVTGVQAVAGQPGVYEVTVGNIAAGNGTLLLGLKAAPGVTIADAAGNVLGNTAAAGTVENYTLDHQAPALPTVARQTTTSTTPTITGTASVGAGERLTVTVNGVTYAEGDGRLLRNGSAWSLALPSALEVGTHAVTATVTDAAGNVSTDASAGELVIVKPADPPASPPAVVPTPAPAPTPIPVTVTQPVADAPAPPPPAPAAPPVVVVAPPPVEAPAPTPAAAPAQVPGLGASVAASLVFSDSGPSVQVSNDLEVNVNQTASSSTSTAGNTEIQSFTVAAKELTQGGGGSVKLSVENGLPRWMKVENLGDGAIKMVGERPEGDARVYQVVVKVKRPNGDEANVVLLVKPTKTVENDTPAKPKQAEGATKPAPNQDGAPPPAGQSAAADWFGQLVAALSGEPANAVPADAAAVPAGFLEQLAQDAAAEAGRAATLAA